MVSDYLILVICTFWYEILHFKHSMLLIDSYCLLSFQGPKQFPYHNVYLENRTNHDIEPLSEKHYEI